MLAVPSDPAWTLPNAELQSFNMSQVTCVTAPSHITFELNSLERVFEPGDSTEKNIRVPVTK